MLTVFDHLTKYRIFNPFAYYWGSGERAKTLKEEDVKVPLPIAERLQVSRNVIKIRFRLPSADHVLGIEPGQHVYLSARIDGKLVVRPYTPVTTTEVVGYVDLIVKVYFAGENPYFPEGGKMSQYLNNLKVGDTVDFRGPSGHVIYKEPGVFSIRVEKKIFAPKRVKTISMIAGGSGITPMLQIAKAIVNNESDETYIKFIFANRTEDDILCRYELEELAVNSCGRFEVWHILSNPPSDWPFSRGHVNAEVIKDHLFPPAEDSVVLLCGPAKMISDACKPALASLGHDAKNILTF